ncbi:P-loop containing nucleoside triphosphate hydrolase protein [Panaeolus papilionaceus]|nr:P-loop containing nucleoside triphosphate hydrolase protein [Panaeolus papilionaceus]
MTVDNLIISGDVAIEPCSIKVNKDSVHVAIMGPTGSGKSTFIEALAGQGQSLKISKDQLAGFTQDVNSYHLKNVHFEHDTISVIDTPGFSDKSISELEIMDKLKTWMSTNGVRFIGFILYLCPITDTRVPGSKRRLIKMLERLLQDQDSRRVTIVTTMWDQLSPQARERSEQHFVQLQTDIWKEFVGRGAQIVKFTNNQQSALDVLRVSMQLYPGWFHLHLARTERGGPCVPILYGELLDRISSARQEWKTFRMDKARLITLPDKQLEACVVPKLQEIEGDMVKFLKQLVAFGTPPPGFDGAPQQVVSQVVLDHVEAAREDISAIKLAISQLRRRDLRRASGLNAQLRETESGLSDLLRYWGTSGNGQALMDKGSLERVLHLLRPKEAKTTHTMANHIKGEFDSLKKRLAVR